MKNSLFGGLVCLIEFFNKIGLASKLQEAMPFTLTSPNAIPPVHTLMAFLSSFIAGAIRFAHTDWLRSAKALHVMLGIERFPGTDTVRNLFIGFTQGTIEAFWCPLWLWLLPLFEQPKEIWIPPYSSEAASRMALPKVTTQGVRAAKHSIRFWRFWRSPVRTPRVATERQHFCQSRCLPFSCGSAEASSCALEDPLRESGFGFLRSGTPWFS